MHVNLATVIIITVQADYAANSYIVRYVISEMVFQKNPVHLNLIKQKPDLATDW